MTETIRAITTDKERAYYGASGVEFFDCEFSGALDGESALKETRSIVVDGCRFLLRYPLWHTEDLKLKNSVMTETCRAPLWYGKNLGIFNSTVRGVKALRECDKVTIGNCEIDSDEFGWKCRDVNIYDLKLKSSYPFFLCERIYAEKLEMTAKYSFQYVKDSFISSSYLDTKDAFWHTENVTVKDCVIKGEYLGWYSKNLTLDHCKIIGTQPLCYCENLKLIDCETEDCDLSFERSTVDASIIGSIVSIKNPVGRIKCKSVGEVIKDEFAIGDFELITKE